MIDPNKYSLTPAERSAIELQLAQVNSDQLWSNCGV